MSINLNNYSFDEWVKFVFDHPVFEPAWYWDDAWDWEGDPNVVLKNASRLFSSPEFLLQEFRPEQIEQGFWFLLGSAGKLDRWVWAKEIDWTIRKDCINSMVNVFEQLFVKNPLGETCYMWWDLLGEFRDEGDPAVRGEMLESLSRVLKIESYDCQISALHGLGHLTHGGKKKIIEEFLNVRSTLDEKTKEYARAAMEGKVQ
jgi:hypothetical protein